MKRQQELAVTTAENLQSQTKGLNEALIRFGEAVETDLDELKNFQIRIAEIDCRLSTSPGHRLFSGLLEQVVFDTHVLDHAELRLQEVNVLLFVLEDDFE